MQEMVDQGALIITDENPAYNKAAKGYAGHQSVCHSAKEYVRGAVHTNTVESSFALVKRGLIGLP